VSAVTTSLFPALPSPARATRLRTRLLHWYGENARDLPWRRTSDAYAILVSEAMLQQTQVGTVIGYYRRFLKAFPDARSLADAKEEDVLALWSGLGYYRRARSLQSAARVMVTEHAGHFPRDEKAALDLPGVGRYTAGAVLSIAYGLPQALVDGNVERVFSRVFGLDGVSGSRELVAQCWELAELLVPQERAGDWNQAVMELGALICTPRQPACAECPLKRSCQARKQGRVSELPRPKVRAAAKVLDVEMLLIRRGPRILLEQRAEDQALGGLWQLPTRVVGDEGEGASGLFPGEWPGGLGAGDGPDLGRLRHGIMRYSIRARLMAGTARGRKGPALAWFEAEQLEALGLTAMARKALAGLKDWPPGTD
jgi:A/G-specific adenine glycosylase